MQSLQSLDNYFKISSMPEYVLKLKADLENIKQLLPLTDNHWQLDLQSPDGNVYIVLLLPRITIFYDHIEL